MTARRRRGGSESDQVPLLGSNATTDSAANVWTGLPTVTYNGPEHTDRQNRVGLTRESYNQLEVIPEYSHMIGAEAIPDFEKHSPKAWLTKQIQVLKPDKVDYKKMTSRDRTLEFGNAVRSLASRQVVRAIAAKDPRKAKHIQSYGEFMVIARTIGKNISSTYAKLEKLTLLAKRKSLFNDRPTEIQELTYIIKEDLNSLNQQIARLQEVSKAQRQMAQTGRQHLLSHSSSVVLALQSKLAAMSTEFKQVLEVRTERLKQAKSRRDQFSQGIVSSSLPPSAMSGHHQGSVLLADEQVSIDLEPRHQMQSQAMVYNDETDQYLTSRAETMQNIESTIVELGGIFQQLAHMVKEQEEMVERIDTNVSDAELNVQSAHSEILKYFQSVTSNRWLMIKIFAVLIFFFIFFVVFLA